MAQKKAAPSTLLAEKVIHAALLSLKERGGEAPVRVVMADVASRATLDDYAREVYEKTGLIRWQSLLHFFSIDCVKAGLLIKKQGIWYLTPEGEKALNRSPADLLTFVRAEYARWKGQQSKDDQHEPADLSKGIEAVEEQNEAANLDRIQQLASDGLVRQMQSRSPYELQDLVAGLLRGMGYYTPFVAPRGKDGGIDVVAYRDPLGTLSPRIRVQVKHREATATVMEVRQLIGVLRKDGDVGLFVSTGGFTADARAAARDAHTHVELVDAERLIALWQEFYGRMSDEDKALLPLVPVFAYAPPG
jgi:restriction system protein